MTFSFNIKLNGKTVTIGGIAGLLLLSALLYFPSLLAISLDSELAQKEIRHHLKWKLGIRHMEEVQSAGLKSPDIEMAKRWQEQLASVDQLEFVAVEIKHLLFVPFFTTDRIFMVKIVSRDKNQQEQTRYFSLSARNKFFDFFWVAEQSRLLWMLSF
jgi:hypothetical protein